MKRFAVLLVLFCLGLTTASFAIAKGKPPGKGKKTTTSSTSTTTSTDPATCHPKISVILKGTFASGGGDSFTMNVTRSNYHGRDLVGQAVTLMVDEKTKFRRRGHAELADFTSGDRLNVQARACKKQKNSAQPTGDQPAPPMLAKRVVGRPANPAESAGETTTTTPAP
jgi:hypothetical protein